MHSTDEAHIEIFWESSEFDKELVPETSFFYSRHIGGLSTFPSPVTVASAPGEIHEISNASGEGLSRCIALDEYSFEIQTKDLDGNNRFSLGQDPQFEIKMIGVDGWAGSGRINNDPSSTATIQSTPRWRQMVGNYLGFVTLSICLQSWIWTLAFFFH